ncbi:intradiol ring-cleavage dioxygenase [Jiangella endophytica]|uniref:intradiol ring-cleavage dioxygenase n=1 Tax=Jiangella endophytica TaxID=1623398 RepID=UPI000E352530|nr:intradiol ring-cleavage dioxygenase [Jiangella endophytica]
MHDEVRASRRLIARRRALGLGGTVGLGAVLAACGVGAANGTGSPAATATPSATGTDLVALLDAVDMAGTSPETTEGPYWFDVDSIRSDLREDRPGATLTLALRVQDAQNTPLPDSVVEIWHCDAGGEYSGFEVASGGPPGSDGGQSTSDGSYSQGDTESEPTDDGTYLRGAQVADADGIVRFTSIYPGWYRGRTVHIHVRVHVDQQTVLTTQLFFDDELSDQVYAAAPYSDHTGRDTGNDADSIYADTGLLTVVADGDGWLGYTNLGV